MRFWLIIIGFLLLQGCAQRIIPPVVELSAQEHQARLAALQQWSIKGKVAVMGGEKNISAHLLWRDSPTQQHLQFTNALGITMAVLEVDSVMAQLTADDDTYVDTSAARLLQQLTGIEIPFEHLRDWMKGQASANDKATYDTRGLLLHLVPDCSECNAWTITYGDYRQIQDLWLPHRLTVLKQSEPVQQIKLRINTWNL